MQFDELFDRLDGRLRSGLGRLGVANAQDQEDLAQNVWAKLASRTTPPENPEAWIFRVGHHEAIRHGRRAAKQRAWEQAAAELGRAGSQGPFQIAQAIEVVRKRLSERQEEILIATINCRTDDELQEQLGYPDKKAAQSARSGVRQRVKQILKSEVDVSYMFQVLSSPSISIDPARIDASPEPEPGLWTHHDGPTDNTAAFRKRMLSLATRLRAQVEEAESMARPQAIFGSLAEYLRQPAVGASTLALWADALRIDAADVSMLEIGEITALDLEPDAVIVLADLLGFTLDDLIDMVLGDAGIRPILTNREAQMRIRALPLSEVELRVRDIRGAAPASC